jgi:hypothetical protein
VRGLGRADTTDKRGQGASELERADRLGLGVEARLRGRGERRLDLNRTTMIRSARVSSKLSDPG